MENNQNRNYDRDEHDYKVKNNLLSEDQPNQIKPNEHHRDGEQFEEFSTEQPNRQDDDDRKINIPPGTEDEKWKTDQNLEDDFYQNNDEEDQRNPLKQDRDI
ncbi:hypothetical protein [Flavobacterium reichenbachii]|uniref:Uncharacterized protein n=1 Tax=Flavobacterium reichenbachii TaxID=362418 RepID=A0A085ZF06_9FLAO|nr:hypothetical protein [Flavobacterium reichenbachii]KFF03020.1 hypothetical protein IW19_23075 [Flavobacterium reichenbachii]OXB17166.1 hypothetical protein B0A68_05045 [Flavobacterium reichenbachii]